MEDLQRLTASFLQRTLKNTVRCTGIGLHTGDAVMMALRPATPGSGIVFRRTDVAADICEIPARYDLVEKTQLCTTLVNAHGICVETVEHLMAALAGCEIDNVVVELDGPEVPIMDGSAEPFVTLIERAGTVEQDAPRRAIRVLHPVTIRDGDRMATLEPAEGFSVCLDIDFPNSAIGRQAIEVDLSSHAFKTEISRARTFGFLHEVEALREIGLARGGSLDNAIVVDGDRIMNEDGLRFDDEFVRHKVLDCVGDMYLAGAPLIGRFRGVRAGHALHNRLLRALFAENAAWATVSMDRLPERDAPLAAEYGSALWTTRAVAATA